MWSGGVAAVGGVAEGVDVEAVEARGEARDLPPHLSMPGGGVLDEVDGAGDRAVDAAAADEGDALDCRVSLHPSSFSGSGTRTVHVDAAGA